MIDNKDSNSKTDFKTVTTEVDYSESLLNLNIYKELDENPNQNLDLLTHIKNQIQQLDLIHKRKMFMIKEIGSVRSR